MSMRIAVLLMTLLWASGARAQARQVPATWWLEATGANAATERQLDTLLARPVAGGTTRVLRVGRSHLVRILRADGQPELFRVTPRGIRREREQLFVTDAAPWTAGREGWVIERDGVGHLGVRGRRGRVRIEPSLPPLGPSVPGLSSAGRPRCEAPRVVSLASRGPSLVALVTECHREAPVRLIRLGAQGREVQVLPPLAFAPGDLAVLPDGRAVVSGADEAQIAIESDARWDRATLPVVEGLLVEARPHTGRVR